MKNKKSITKQAILTSAIAGSMALIPLNVFADGVGIVTIGANLNKEQREMMFNFFGVKENQVEVMEVNNQQERKYLEGVLPDEQIGRKTYSCAYIKPTNKGQINVKTANLNYINAAIIKSTIVTLSPKSTSFDIVVAAPIEVSGTGGITGIILSLEKNGEKIDEDKKEIATEELIITGDLGEDIGTEKAVGIINDIKTNIIKENTKDTTQIAQTITNVTNNYNINLSNSQEKQIQELMEKISQQEYNYKDLKKTLNSIKENVNDSLKELGEKVNNTTFFEDVKNLFTNICDRIEKFFTNILNNEDTGIIDTVNEEALGDNVIISSSEDISNTNNQETNNKNFFERIMEWIKNLFPVNKNEELINEKPATDIEEQDNDTEKEPEFEVITQEDESFSSEDNTNAQEDSINRQPSEDNLTTESDYENTNTSDSNNNETTSNENQTEEESTETVGE